MLQTGSLLWPTVGEGTSYPLRTNPQYFGLGSSTLLPHSLIFKSARMISYLPPRIDGSIPSFRETACEPVRATTSLHFSDTCSVQNLHALARFRIVSRLS